MSWNRENSQSKWSPPPGDEFHERWNRIARSADDYSLQQDKDDWRERDSRHRRRTSRDRDDKRGRRSRERSRSRNYDRERSPQGRDYSNDKYHDRDNDKDSYDDDRRSNSSRRRSPRRRSRSPNYSRSRSNRSRSHSPPRHSRDRSPHSRGSPSRRYREESDKSPAPGDWYCRCGALNFRRRSVCYWRDCGAKREEAEVVTPHLSTTSGLSSVGMTRILLLRPIGPKTAAEDILSSLSEQCPNVASTMSGVSLIRGGARLQFNTLSEASGAFASINALNPSLQIGGHSVFVTYYSDKAVTPELPAPVNPDYTAYYSTYASETDRVNAAAAVAQSAINQLNAVRSQWVTPMIIQPTLIAPVPPKGDGSQVYPVPDTSSFMYDESSGFYYDATTGLYYDSNTQYFYNNQIGQYMYWDAARNTYLLAPQSQNSQTASDETNADESKASANDASKDEKKKPINKDDKVKVAKKIAKDMERWAKTLNQKKENARNGIVIEQQLQQAAASSGSADIGYKVLEKSESRVSAPTLPHIVAPYSAPLSFKPEVENPKDTIQRSFPVDEDENIVDWQKLSCLLCKRQFNSADVLKKHVELSNLHKENLARHRKSELEDCELNDDVASMSYRDRAAERRLKFGEEDAPPFKPPLMPVPRASYAAPPEPQPLDATSVGGRLLSKMGWSEGTGLGRSRSGRTSPVRAERRSNLAGLGQKRGVYQAAPGETYRDTVKKLAIARYQDLLQEEQGSKRT